MTAKAQPVGPGNQPRAVDQVAAPDILRRSARVAISVQLILAVANGVYLFVFPGRAATDYAWSIKPEINAAYMGAGYLAGILAGVLGVFLAQRWRSVRALMWPFLVLSVAMLAATLIHRDRFRWGYVPTWIWTLVYLGIPFGVVFIWLRQERLALSKPEHDARLRAVRLAAGALGLVQSAVAVWQFASPQSFVAHWPWSITPLLARAFSAWHLLIGSTLLAVALSARRGHELVTPMGTLAVWAMLLLTLPLLYGADVDSGRTSFWVWLAMVIAVLGVSAWAVAVGLRGMRAAREHL